MTAKEPHIVIDARFLDPDSSGNGRLSFDLLARLLPITPHRLTILVPPRSKDVLRPYLQANQQAIVTQEPWYSLAEQLSFRRRLLELQPTVVHFLHFNHPLRLPIPYIVTIPDLVLDDYPTPSAGFLKRRLYRLVMADAVSHSQVIIAVTEATKNDLIERYQAEPAKVRVVYEAVDSLRQPPSLPTATPLSPTLTKLGVQSPYLLYVGQQRIHKNIDGLIRGFVRFKKQTEDRTIKLVLAGKIDPAASWVNAALTEAGPLASDIIRTDFVSDTDLVLLFRHALAFVFPSFKEGFGLPPLEAMRYNLPVASSNASCLPEVLGDAALYFDPTSPAAIAKTLAQITADTTLRARLISLGKAQEKRYTWKHAAEQTLRLYDDVIKQLTKES